MSYIRDDGLCSAFWIQGYLKPPGVEKKGHIDDLHSSFCRLYFSFNLTCMPLLIYSFILNKKRYICPEMTMNEKYMAKGLELVERLIAVMLLEPRLLPKALKLQYY